MSGLQLGGFPLGLLDLGPPSTAPFTFDGPNKLIIVDSGITTFGVRQLISRWSDWLTISDNLKYLPALNQVGGNDIDPAIGSSIPIYGFLLNGWKIRPQEANHTLTVTDGVLLVEGGGDPFVNTLGSFVVRVNYQQPVQAITVATGGGGAGPTASEIAIAVDAILASKLSVITSLSAAAL